MFDKIIPTIEGPIANLIHLDLSKYSGLEEEGIKFDLNYLTKLNLVDIISKTNFISLNTNWIYQEEQQCLRKD